MLNYQHFYLFLSTSAANFAMLEMLRFNKADVRMHEHGYAVKLPRGTKQISRMPYERQNAHGIKMSGEHFVYELPTKVQIRYMRRFKEEPVGLNDTLVTRESKVVINSNQYQEA